jgi:hypothetical protein
MGKRRIPKTITREQADEFVRLHCEAIRALGIDPNLVTLNGIKRHDYGFMVKAIVPPEGWDGEGIPPSQLDPARPFKVLSEKHWVGIDVAEVRA